jgi:FtsH-binding integral membrane protein
VLMGYNCLGAHFVLFPTAMVKTFGIRAGSQLYSMLYIGIGAQQIGCMFLSFFLSKKLKSKVYFIMFIVAVGLTLVSVTILYFFQEKVVRRSKSSSLKEIE